MNQHDDEQKKIWNSVAGCAWVELQELLDQIYKPFEDLLVDAVSATPRRLVLDVGCGTGGVTLAVARVPGASSSCLGIDISDPMITAARARAERESLPARFICADAQVYPFEPACCDMIVSRFGVMFFADPVEAFANLRRAAADNASLACIAWRAVAENPFMTTAERAAAPLLTNLPARVPDAPGQFAFAKAEKVHAILETSGWTGIDIRPIDIPCTMPERDLMTYLTRLGPVGSVLQDVDVQTRARVIETIRPAFDSYVHGPEVRFTAACWMVSARATDARAS